MSDYTDSFIAYLQSLTTRDRGTLAVLRRSLGFAPGAYPPAYPSVERFAKLCTSQPACSHFTPNMLRAAASATPSGR